MVTITFSQSLLKIQLYNKTIDEFINKTVLSLSITPNSFQSLTDVAFDWKTVSMDGNKLKIQLDISKPLKISFNVSHYSYQTSTIGLQLFESCVH